MSDVIYEAVPFIRIGNRRGLTFEKITEDPCLREFVDRFPSAFEFDMLRGLVLLRDE